MFWPWLTSLHCPQTFNTAKLLVLNMFTEAARDILKFWGNLSFFTLYLTDNLAMTNFLLYPLTFTWANINLNLNILSKVPRGQIKKVMNLTFWFDIYLNGLAFFLREGCTVNFFFQGISWNTNFTLISQCIFYIKFQLNCFFYTFMKHFSERNF